MLEIKELTLDVNSKRVLKEVNLSIEKGEFHVLLGPNVTVETSLLLSVVGIPKLGDIVNICVQSKSKSDEITPETIELAKKLNSPRDF